MTFQERYQYNPQTDLLGKGGFARVYKAYDVLLKREVAIKVFPSGDKEKYSVIEEISKAIGLQHPSLLRYYDVALVATTNSFGEKENLQIGVMELANYGDLKIFIKNNPHSPFINTLLIQVLEGLSYLHSKGIIHRDLKPQNILLLKDENGIQAKISDFGISKDMGSSGESSSAVLGTIEYMSPEQFNPKKYGIDGKISTNLDLWSFGIMVYELFTGTSLFGRRSDNITSEQIMNAILSSSQYLPSDVGKLFEPYQSIVRKCLVANANFRVKEAKELITLLKNDFTPAESSDETQAYSFDNINEEFETEAIDKELTENKTVFNTISHLVSRKKAYVIAFLVMIVIIASVYLMKENEHKNVDSVTRAVTDSIAVTALKSTENPIKSIENNMVYVEGGSFKMGSSTGENYDSPVHPVSVNSFRIGRYEVTQKEWEAVMGSNPSENKGCSICPVENVSWHDIQEFLQKLNAQTGKHYSLPTEAEWEYAARGGKKSKNYIYSGSDDINKVAWYIDNSGYTSPHKVGEKQANELGIYDMSGNVWEWCSDWYDEYYYKHSPISNPTGAKRGVAKSLRGGEFREVSIYCLVSYRSRYKATLRSSTCGFRVVVAP